MTTGRQVSPSILFVTSNQQDAWRGGTYLRLAGVGLTKQKQKADNGEVEAVIMSNTGEDRCGGNTFKLA